LWVGVFVFSLRLNINREEGTAVANHSEALRGGAGGGKKGCIKPVHPGGRFCTLIIGNTGQRGRGTRRKLRGIKKGERLPRYQLVLIVS